MNAPQEKYTIEYPILQESAQGFQEALSNLQKEAYDNCGHTVNSDKIYINKYISHECFYLSLVVYDFININYKKQIKIYEEKISNAVNLLKNDGRFKIEQTEDKNKKNENQLREEISGF